MASIDDPQPELPTLEPAEAPEELIVEIDPDGLVRYTSHPDWLGDGGPRTGELVTGALALDGAALLALLERVHRTGRSERVSGRLLGAGELKTVIGHVIPLRDASGHRGWVLALRPEPDLATRLLEASPGILIRAVEQMNLGAILSDRDGRIVYANTTEAAMHGYHPDELIGQHVGRLGSASRSEPPESEVIGDGPWVRTRVNRRRDGTLFPVRLISNEIRDEEGALLGRFTISEDISERARLERMKEEFIRVVSHELRTPLTSVITSLALLDRGSASELKEREREALAIAERNSRHLLELVHELIDLQNAVSGHLGVHPELISVGEVLHQAAERATPNRSSRSAVPRRRIVVEPDPEIDRDDRCVRADRRRLLQVLDSLISNALKFSPASEPVVLGASRYPGHTTLTVTDRGPGIPDELRRYLFEPFIQADTSTTRSGPGAGLGLALAKALVERMGGKLELIQESESAPPGTTVLVHLPDQ